MRNSKADLAIDVTLEGDLIVHCVDQTFSYRFPAREAALQLSPDSAACAATPTFRC